MLTRLFVITLCACVVAACSSVVSIPSSNQSSRVDYVVIHATSANYAESVRLLTTETDYPVSSHYLIPRVDDPSYPSRRVRLHRFVEERERAWHAGLSFWAGETRLNDRSIGIEIVNEFSCAHTSAAPLEAEPDQLDCTFPNYTQAQIDVLIELLADIQRRYPDLDPVDIVGHADIATMRKSDPGPLFPWRALFEAGIGAWFDEEDVAILTHRFTTALPAVRDLQIALGAYGYEVEPSGILDRQTRFALRAFQMHFRPGDFSGEPDAQTAAILWNLLQRYRADHYRELNLESIVP